jgi:hypothetical protein
MVVDLHDVKLESGYAKAIGLAVWCFAGLEWNAVWCAERIMPGTLNDMMTKKMTAGDIAKRLRALVRKMPSSPDQEQLLAAAEEFVKLAETRNQILHGKPASTPDQRHRLNSKSGLLEVQEIRQASERFHECSGKLNHAFHGFLASYVSP